MFSKKHTNKTTYGIIGLGRFGTALAHELASSGAELIVLDKNEDKIREMREYTENAYIVTNLEKKTLEETGIQNCDVAIVCIGEQMDTSLLTTLNLINLGVPKVISKAASAEHGVILEKLGAEVVYPERDMALRLASRLDTARELDIIQLGEKITISKLRVPERLVGKTVLDADLRARFGLNIIAVENGTTVLENIRPDHRFAKGDVLFLVGSKNSIMKLNDWVIDNE